MLQDCRWGNINFLFFIFYFIYFSLFFILYILKKLAWNNCNFILNNPFVAIFLFFFSINCKIMYYHFFFYLLFRIFHFVIDNFTLAVYCQKRHRTAKINFSLHSSACASCSRFFILSKFFFKKNAIRPTLLPYTDLNQKSLPPVKPRLWNPPQRAWSFFSMHQTKKWPAYQRNSRTTPKQHHFFRTAASAAMRLEWRALLTQNLPRRSFSTSPKRKLPHHLQWISQISFSLKHSSLLMEMMLRLCVKKVKITFRLWFFWLC